MVDSFLAAHVTTVHNPLDPRIYRKEIATLRSASIETWLIARDTQGREPDPHFLGLTNEPGIWNRLRRHVQAFRHLETVKPHLVHVHDPELIPLAFLIRRRSGCKVIYDMHEDYAGRGRFGGRILRWLEKWCFRWVDHVILAESSYDGILRGRSTPSTPVLNYVLPVTDRLPDRFDEPLTLIYTGTISNCRGLNHMLDLAAEIKREHLDWRIRIVGVSHLPAERQSAEDRIREEGLESVVTTVGWKDYVPWHRIVEHYADAQIGLALFEPLPNHMESILSKFYEYIYFGLPVVHADFPLWTAFFEDNGCGVAVNPAKPMEVVGAIRSLLDRGRLREMRRKATEVRDDYVWMKMEPRLIGLYDELQRNGGVSPRTTAQSSVTE